MQPISGGEMLVAILDGCDPQSAGARLTFGTFEKCDDAGLRDQLADVIGAAAVALSGFKPFACA
jgi:hypothetical protein